MRAAAITADVPTVTLDDSVATALRALADGGLPGLIVVDPGGRAHAVLPGTQVLRMCIGLEYQDDVALTRVVDEESADAFSRRESRRLVRDCLPPHLPEPATVPPAATLLEVAAVMARLRSPLVAVVDDAGAPVGGITLASVLHHLDLPTD